MERVGATVMIATALLAAGCTCGDDGDRDALEVTAAAWPAGDRLFRTAPRWLGGDAAFSVDLGAGRTLWLFGDSFIATSAAHKRSESKMVRNSAAIQRGADPSKASMTFCWGDAAGQPASFVPEAGATWFWPGHGVRLGGTLLLALSRVVKDSSAGSLGFRATGWEVRRVQNPNAPPSSWTLPKVALPATSFALVGGVSFLVRGGHLYAYGVREPDSHDVVLQRWDRARAAKGDLGAPEWWLGQDRGWVAQSALGGQRPATLFRGATELSVHHDAGTGRYLELQTEGFGAAELVLRSAPAPEGPWSTAQKVFRPPESNRGGKVIVYAGKAHPQLGSDAGGGLLATYVANSLDFAELVKDDSLYRPRFVRLTVGR
jgi:hypothetical protein